MARMLFSICITLVAVTFAQPPPPPQVGAAEGNSGGPVDGGAGAAAGLNGLGNMNIFVQNILKKLREGPSVPPPSNFNNAMIENMMKEMFGGVMGANGRGGPTRGRTLLASPAAAIPVSSSFPSCSPACPSDKCCALNSAKQAECKARQTLAANECRVPTDDSQTVASSSYCPCSSGMVCMIFGASKKEGFCSSL